MLGTFCTLYKILVIVKLTELCNWLHKCSEVISTYNYTLIAIASNCCGG